MVKLTLARQASRAITSLQNLDEDRVLKLLKNVRRPLGEGRLSVYARERESTSAVTRLSFSHSLSLSLSLFLSQGGDGLAAVVAAAGVCEFVLMGVWH